MRFVGLLLYFWALTAHANVFGVDRRVPVTTAAYPIQSLGLVRQVASGQVLETCTGTLIGARLVLTAAHCVARVADHLNKNVGTVFYAADHAAYRAVDVWGGSWRLESDPRGGDWAVLLLDRATNLETLPIASEPLTAGGHLALLGYSVDRGAVLTGDFDCRVRLVLADGVFHHDCALFAGASGGPILMADGAGWKIVGVQSAHKSDGTVGLKLAGYDSRFANLGVQARNFLPVVERLRRLYEAPVVATAPVPR